MIWVLLLWLLESFYFYGVQYSRPFFLRKRFFHIAWSGDISHTSHMDVTRYTEWNRAWISVCDLKNLLSEVAGLAEKFQRDWGGLSLLGLHWKFRVINVFPWISANQYNDAIILIWTLCIDLDWSVSFICNTLPLIFILFFHCLLRCFQCHCSIFLPAVWIQLPPG